MSDPGRLVRDCFDPWRESPAALLLVGQRGFARLEYDRDGINGLGGTPPRFAVWAEGPHGIVAIESRHGDQSAPKPAGVAASFLENLTDKRRSSPLLGDMTRMATVSDYVQLDALALIKAYVGLVRADRPATLLYLFREPPQPTPDSSKHRSEVAAFAKAANISGARFEAQSYVELWASWEKQGEPAWLAGHVATLRQRYLVEI